MQPTSETEPARMTDGNQPTTGVNRQTGVIEANNQ
jgi:hypothetical protein